MISHVWREPTGKQKFLTIAHRLHWSYANLAMAHAALKNKADAYGPFPYYQIRSRLYTGLNAGTMNMASLFQDERLKLLSPARCAYCGANSPTTADHLIPRVHGGEDAGENLVPACRSCNSAKGAQDVMAWHRARGMFPSLSVTRRYLKLATQAARQADAMETRLDDPVGVRLPFNIAAVPTLYPLPAALVWEIGDRA